MLVEFKELPKDVRKNYTQEQADKFKCESAPDGSLFILTLEAIEATEKVEAVDAVRDKWADIKGVWRKVI